MEEITKNLEKETAKTIELFKKELSQIRTNRPTPLLVEDILVDYYGTKVPIKQLGAIGINPPREITIQAWDKNALPFVAKAVETSNLNVKPVIDGGLVRINLPELSVERRQELIIVVKKLAEESRIKLRSCRDEVKRKANSYFAEGKIGEDEKFRTHEKIQKMIDQTNTDIEKILEAKIKEINL